jgi:hypothetical protein
MTPDQIIKHDAEHNQEDMSLDEIVAQINHEINNEGARLVQEGNTLIIFKTKEDGSCEFHCFNADTPENLAKNVVTFLTLAKKLGYPSASTPYKNPAVSHLIKKFFTGKFDFEINHTEDGYVAEVTL